MPKHLLDMVIDELPLAAGAPDNEIVKSSLEAMKKQNEQSDKEKVDAAVGAYRAGGLGVVGPDDTLRALTNGQVDELLVTASLSRLGTPRAHAATANDAGLAEPIVEPAAAGEAAQADVQTVRLADELVTKARQTGATVTFIEDDNLLAPYNGVAGLLRFRI
jgi:peptide subunit release factor 1 (eRF1)